MKIKTKQKLLIILAKIAFFIATVSLYIYTSYIFMSFETPYKMTFSAIFHGAIWTGLLLKIAFSMNKLTDEIGIRKKAINDTIQHASVQGQEVGVQVLEEYIEMLESLRQQSGSVVDLNSLIDAMKNHRDRVRDNIDTERAVNSVNEILKK